MSTVLSLEGKTAIVTGGAGGLGLAITELFLEAGANVVAADINTDLVQKFEASHDKSKAFAVEANVTLEDDIHDLFIATIKRFGQVDIIVNNAGPRCRVPRDWWPARRTRELRVKKTDSTLYEAGFADLLRF
jgi:NAD(P)-dependent dehydrogenase (short-subunit alcohol dehydrogenase family)